MIGDGVLADSSDDPTIRSASDYSYTALSYAGPHYRVVGDAAGGQVIATSCLVADSNESTAFIDPYFSSGVHLALSGALSASATICASIKGQCDEDLAARWHTASVGTAYTRCARDTRRVEAASYSDDCLDSFLWCLAHTDKSVHKSFRFFPM